MNIELSDKQINALVKEVIRERIKNYLNKVNIEEEIHDVIIRTVQDVVLPQLSGTYADVQAIAKEIATDTVVERVSERVSKDIAEAFADKYSY